MARQAHNDVLDALLNEIATGVMLRVCSGAGAPADRAAAITATLASVAVDSGDFSNADDTSGRRVTVAAQNSVSITATGDATHVCIDDGTTLLFATTCTTQTLTSGGTVNIPAFDINPQDPVAP